MLPDISVVRGSQETEVFVDGVLVPKNGMISVDCEIRPDSLTEVVVRYVTDSFSAAGPGKPA